jgi:hypothetical protein
MARAHFACRARERLADTNGDDIAIAEAADLH